MEPERDDELERMFAAARGPAPVPDTLMARVLADAAQVQAARAAVPARRAAPGRWQRLVWALGGHGALAGLAAAGLAGVWIGFAQPVGLPYLTETVELIPGDDAFWQAIDAETAAETGPEG